MTLIEEKQLKGITSRLIFWIIGGTVSICFTATATYYGIKTQIKDALDVNNTQSLQLKNITDDDKTRDLAIRAMQIQLNTIEYKVNALTDQQKINKK